MDAKRFKLRSMLEYAPTVARPALAQGELERTIGLKWAGWFGAAVLVVGAALGIKFAYDQGWLGGLPDVVKLLLMSLAGFGLIAAGELVLRRVNRLSAAGLYGAGVAVLFLVGYAGYAWYNVYAQSSAFALMGVATVIGVLVAARADLVSIAVLSLLGGHAAPALLQAKPESLVPFLSYLLLLQSLALVLCYWRATPKWWTLRSLSLVGTTLWQLVVLDDATTSAAGNVAASSTFLIIYAAAYQFELIATTLRRDRLAAAAPFAQVAGTNPVSVTAGVLFSVIVTALFIACELRAHHTATANIRGLWVLATAAACGGGGFALRALRRPSLGPLSASLRGQACGLLVLAVPVFFHGPSLVLGWLALAVGFGVLGEIGRLRLASVAALMTWALAIVALVIWTNVDEAARLPWLTLAGTQLTAVWFVALAATGCGHGVAVLFERGARRGESPEMLGGLVRSAAADLWQTASAVHGLAGILFASVTIIELPGLAGTFALLAYAWVACGASFVAALRRFAYLAAAAVLVAGVKWAVVDLLRERLQIARARPVFNAGMLTGVVIAASLATVGWSRRAVFLGRAVEQRQRLYQSFLALLATFVLVIGLSAQVPQIVDAAGPSAYAPAVATLLTWTMLWVAAATILLLVDRLVIRPQETSIASLSAAALIALAAKYLLVDTLAMRWAYPPAAVWVIANLPTLTALVVWGGLTAVALQAPNRSLRAAAPALGALVLLVLGSVEIDRFAAYQSAGPVWIVRQAGWSIWWSLFAVGAVIIGFGVRATFLRVVGLAVFALTLVKVVLVDLAGAGTGWRILSFIGLGVLLLGTSVLYGRLSPRSTER